MRGPYPTKRFARSFGNTRIAEKKGYDLTERFFSLLREQFPTLQLIGPERAGKDVLLGSIFHEYTKIDRPIDFLICDGAKILAVGLARYDSDRGGAQEDDRTGQYRDCANEVLTYATRHDLPTKVIFLNDGPGLLLGSMWRDYAYIEDLYPGRVMVTTLRMIPERLSLDWLTS